MRRSYFSALVLVGLLIGLAVYWSWGRSRRPRLESGTASIEFLDVGQGDAILIRSPEGKTALIDAGPSGRIVDLLRSRGVESIDLAVVSHHHGDHYGGMLEVVSEYPPKVFLDADSPHVTSHYLKLLERINDGKITAIRAGPTTRRITLGSITLVVFPQAPSNEHNENNNSVGIRVEFGRFSSLLTGDSEASERRWWMKQVPELCAEVDVLKLAHHGSRNGTDPAWLLLTRPSLAVASLGLDNEFGHPHPQTLAMLRAQEIPLRRTDQSGSIEILTDGQTWSLTPSSSSSAEPSTWDSSGRSSRRPSLLVGLNTSTEAELRALPGIGPVLAARIIEGRPYRTIDDLAAVPSLSKKRIEQIRPLLIVD